MFDLKKLIRPHIFELQPYSTARHEYSGSAAIFLDANENPFGSASSESFNRYPDPFQKDLKNKLAQLKSVAPENILLGNGSDEVIDLIFRLFCSPGKDNTIILPPTYGMYEVSASINDVHVKKISLTPEYQIDVEAVLDAVDENTKIIWICSPNNPTGNSLRSADINMILESFPGIVVIDEAYIDFSSEKSYSNFLQKHPNLIVMQTFSKSWGFAALRLGMAFSSPEIIKFLNKIKPPYNINSLTQSHVLKALENVGDQKEVVKAILDQKKILSEELQRLSIVKKVYPSDSNFLLIKVSEGKKIYDYLVQKGIIVRDRSQVKLCEDSLRITVGTDKENAVLLKELKEYSS